MRTNTWLGLLAVGQAAQSFEMRRATSTLQGMLTEFAEQQRARDEVRDLQFAQAHLAAQRGQFAMWIQTPEGKIFDAWSVEARAVSRALDDRQTAWEAAWAIEDEDRRYEWVENEKARERRARESATKKALAEVPEARPRGGRRDYLVRGTIALSLSLFFAAMWIIIVLIQANTPEALSGGPKLSFESLLFFALAPIPVPLAVWWYWKAGQDTRARQLRDERLAEAYGKYYESEMARSPGEYMERRPAFSWHREWGADDIRRFDEDIRRFFESAHLVFPRPSALPALESVFESRGPNMAQGSNPDSINALLAGFAEEDRRRRHDISRASIE